MQPYIRHFLDQLRAADVVTWWKVVSIAFTGAFGILGLATEFKHKETKKITRWGYAALVGIVVSTACGVAAQLKQSTDDAAKALAVGQASARELSELDRVLSPLGGSSLALEFAIPCRKVWKKRCQKVERLGEAMGNKIDLGKLFEVEPSALQFGALVFQSRESVMMDQEPLFGAGETKGLEFIVGSPGSEDSDDLSIQIRLAQPNLINAGTIQSVRDLSGKFVVVAGQVYDEPLSFQPTFVEFESSIGERVGCDSFEKVRNDDMDLYGCQLRVSTDVFGDQ